MQTISLAVVEGLFDGHVSVRRRPAALQPLRLPVEELGFYDPYTRWVASAAAGVRLRFITDTRALRLTAQQRLAAPANEGEMRPQAYDLPDDLHPNAAGYARMGERFHARMLAPGTGAWASHLTAAAAAS